MNGVEEQLRALVNYKRDYIYETIIGLPLAFLGICLTLYFENATSPIGIFFVALGFTCGVLCGLVGWKKHQHTMQEIEANLEELEE